MSELVIFDLDNTLIKGQSQKLFLSYFFKKGLITRFFYIKLMFWFVLYKIGIVKNPKKTMEYAFSFLKDMNVDEFNQHINNFFEQRLKYYIFKDSIEIVKKNKNQDRKILIASNAIKFIPQRVTQFLNVDYYIGTKLEIENNKFTGKIDGDIIYGKNKVFAIKKFIKENNLSLKNSWGYSDHHSDLPFLEIVDFPVVVNPSKKLLKKAQEQKWPILKFKETIN